MSDPAAVRLFVALSVPDSFTAQAARLPRKGLDAQWSHPDDLHLTLRFLGDLDATRLPSIEEALSRVRRPSLNIEVRGLGVFGSKSQSVLYAKIESVRKVTALCADITGVLTPLGFDFGMREFVPHITLARVKQERGLDEYVRRYGTGLAARWEAAAFSLMRSALPDEKGRHYSVLSSYKLDH